MERAFLEAQLEAGRSLEQIGRMVRRDPSTVGYWIKKHGLTAAHRDKHAPKGGLSREALEEEIAAGASVREIALAHSVCEGTVRHWLRRFGLRTARAARLQARKAAHRTEKEILDLPCRRHGVAPHVLEGRGSYRCTRCRSEWVSARRRRVKAALVEEAGGRCVLCGYDRCLAALEFHHVDPAQKAFAISRAGVTRSIDSARREAAKCVLVCANCHSELEAGAATLQIAHPTSDVGCR
jgi:transposase